MKFLGTLFIIIFIIWLIGQVLSRYWPYIAMWLLKRHVRKQMDQTFRQGTYSQARSQTQYDPFGHFRRKKSQAESQAHHRGKKISPDVGEYVEFEEITYYAETTTQSPAPFKPEPQIEDADWEDLK